MFRRNVLPSSSGSSSKPSTQSARSKQKTEWATLWKPGSHTGLKSSSERIDWGKEKSKWWLPWKASFFANTEFSRSILVNARVGSPWAPFWPISESENSRAARSDCCSLLARCLLGFILDLEDGGSMIHRRVSEYLLDYKTSHSRR
jgi:hypothetical protein